MIILGEQHKFTHMEMAELQKNFSAIKHVSYHNLSIDDVLHRIEELVVNKNKSIILLNTKAHIPNKLIEYLISLESKGVQFITTESFFEKFLHKCYIPEDQTNVAFLENIRPYSLSKYFLKRTIDYIGIATIGLIASPLIIYSIYRIRRESPGSILFKQQRVGENGKIFVCYKFRSMDENTHFNPYTEINDKRIYPWGKAMRKTRIDELPQLWNVFWGEMHIFGPRAEWDILVENYKHEIPYYQERHLVRPGITGWAQVSYPYGSSTEDAKQKLMYDLYYIKYWSLWLEIKTAWKTIMVILGKKGL